ncbi:hypothetical protein [uncultured Clostridium sp.]|uniref:hypothetical protein n=1 Tax=uncultured Clostridium sp. TaxID=59620 RepID=UPI0028E3EA63|nr:hypothetical protein [uncultured Clostridium sp.]
MNKIYNFDLKGISTKEELESVTEEINNCEVCNDNNVILQVKEFKNDENRDLVIGTINIIYHEDVDIIEILAKIVRCESCHNSVSIIAITPALKFKY